MSGVLTLRIELENGTGLYLPGAVVRGTVAIESSSSWRVGVAELILFWQTSGRGNRNSAMAGHVFLLPKDAVATPRVERPFALKLPVLPHSYTGVNIKLQWVIGAYVRAVGGVLTGLEVPISMGIAAAALPATLPERPPE